MLVTLGEPLLASPATARDRVAGVAAAAAYQAAFERLDRMARRLRAEGWANGVDAIQQLAEVSFFAARAEHRGLER